MRIGDIFKEKAAKSPLIIFIFIVIFSISFSYQAFAKVTGVCYNCHTMHNSQNGGNVLMTGTDVGWDTSTTPPKLAGGILQGTPAKNLLVTDCVGCHSSTSNETIINVGGSRIPIVYSINGTTKQLAGGNFYWVATDDTKGHNVYGISGADSNLDEAPGNVNCGGFTSPCHKTLAAEPQTDNFNKGGCQGCHYYIFHHTDNDVYRFLNGHEGGPTSHYVEGEEDPDWEQNPTASHNWYKGFDGPVNGGTLDTTRSMSTFCGGCHKEFHRQAYIGGTSSPWTRHPTDIALPQGDGSEYALYTPATNYSAEAPVAWTDPTNSGNRGTPIVMCLSCHRPHGSSQPDMLRWDYSGMTVGTIAGAGKGCFTCHRNKDGA